MNPLVIIGVAAAVGVGVSMLVRKQNAVERWLADFWELEADDGADEALAQLIERSGEGDPVDVWPGFTRSLADWILVRGDWAFEYVELPRGSVLIGMRAYPQRFDVVFAPKTAVVSLIGSNHIGLSSLDTDSESVLLTGIAPEAGLGQVVEGGDRIGLAGSEVHFDVQSRRIPALQYARSYLERQDVYEDPRHWLIALGMSLVRPGAGSQRGDLVT